MNKETKMTEEEALSIIRPWLLRMIIKNRTKIDLRKKMVQTSHFL